MEESLISNREQSRHTDLGRRIALGHFDLYERSKYLFRRAVIVRPLGPNPQPPPLRVLEISIPAIERLVLPSETKSVRGDLSGGGYGGVFNFK